MQRTLNTVNMERRLGILQGSLGHGVDPGKASPQQGQALPAAGPKKFAGAKAPTGAGYEE